MRPARAGQLHAVGGEQLLDRRKIAVLLLLGSVHALVQTFRLRVAFGHLGVRLRLGVPERALLVLLRDRAVHHGAEAVGHTDLVLQYLPRLLHGVPDVVLGIAQAEHRVYALRRELIRVSPRREGEVAACQPQLLEHHGRVLRPDLPGE